MIILQEHSKQVVLMSPVYDRIIAPCLPGVGYSINFLSLVFCTQTVLYKLLPDTSHFIII